MLGLMATLGAGRAEDSAAARIAAGRLAYSEGRFTEALASFERAIVFNPGGAVPRYNAAAALFRLERYSEASERYREARERADAALRTKIDYALGNTALALGDLSAALGHYDDCLASTTRGKVFDGVRLDAAINRRYAEEQAKHPSDPPESNDDPSSSNRPPSPKPDGGEDESQNESGANGNDSAGGDKPPVNRTSQRPGRGAGGSTAPNADSPEGRLDAALKNIREARSRRVDDPLPPTDRQRMDW
jgi:Ca-activated chloride channel family protein